MTRAAAAVAPSTVLHEACEHGDTERVKSLLSIATNVAMVSAKNSKHLSPMHLAALNGHVGPINAILDVCPTFGMQLFRTTYPITPMYAASYRGHLRVVETLLERGMYYNQANDGNDNETPLYAACAKGHHQIVEALIRRDAHFPASIFSRTRSGDTPLHVACRMSNVRVLKVLERFITSTSVARFVDVTDGRGYTALLTNCASKTRYTCDPEIFLTLSSTVP